jgi:nitrogen fixation/metabolism regulation signal transduction histidine kinase
MSEASTAAPVAGGRHHRSAKNYLLDPRFQLKYTSFLVGIALFLSAALGIILWNTSTKVIEQSNAAVQQGQETVKQGQETVERGKAVILESKKVNAVVTMTMKQCYADDPELQKTFAAQTVEDETKMNQEQTRLEGDAERLKKQADALAMQKAQVEAQQKTILGGLAGVLSLLVVGIGIAGIVFTHKIAGPIFKMKRLLRQVGEGKLVLRERLRKGDELQEFFETFEKMVDSLRHHQEQEIAKVDRILERLETAPVSQRGNKELDDDGITLLKKLRSDMQSQLEA